MKTKGHVLNNRDYLYVFSDDYAKELRHSKKIENLLKLEGWWPYTYSLTPKRYNRRTHVALRELNPELKYEIPLDFLV